MLSERTLAIVREITPAVAENAEKITCRFYQRMFAGNPEVKAYFNQAHQHSGGQQRALAGAICAYFTHIDRLEALTPAVELIAQKHCSLQIKPEHYPIVGKHLLDAIKDVMGEAATPEIINAVAEAYGLLADVCIGREAAIYSQQLAKPGGWNGYRRFVVNRKEIESDVVTSFYLTPEDAEAIAPYDAGQYITIRIDPTKLDTAPRNYSLSDRSGTGYYRISVKREAGTDAGSPGGLVSNYLHDHVNVGDILNVGPPCGEFTLGEATKIGRPHIFLAAGVGITPILAMTKELVDHSDCDIYLLQAARSASWMPFTSELDSLAASCPRLHCKRIVEQSEKPPVNASTSNLPNVQHATGLLSVNAISQWAPYDKAEFYICGPRRFMAVALGILKELGVSEDRIHHEFFGPKQTLAVNAAYSLSENH